ncbi:hypothetical protein V8V55_27320 [Priestia megaterium]|uniref:hypothetical protein n=1 Tax=Priestia megaterium TaxID=1404 RepID=UPI0030091D77
MYIVGIQIGKKREPLSFDLGYFGDLLVGVGAGILAKVTIELGDIDNDYALISAALLAGFAGMSYMLKFQRDEEEGWEQEQTAALRNIQITGEESSEHGMDSTVSGRSGTSIGTDAASGESQVTDSSVVEDVEHLQEQARKETASSHSN